MNTAPPSSWFRFCLDLLVLAMAVTAIAARAESHRQRVWFPSGRFVLRTLSSALCPLAVTPSGKFSPDLSADNPTNSGPDRSAAEAALRRALQLEQTAPTTFKVGAVTFDRQTRTVTIPARVNMNQGAVEYALVTTGGKTHESIFSTDTRPDQVHLACLLLGLAPSEITGAMSQAQTVPSANALEIQVTWETSGHNERHSLSELVWLRTGDTNAPDKPLPVQSWFYNGSQLRRSGFAAQAEGSFISLIRDPVALMNNPAPDRDNDLIHFPNTKVLPRVGAPVQVHLVLAPNAAATAASPELPADPKPGPFLLTNKPSVSSD